MRLSRPRRSPSRLPLRPWAMTPCALFLRVPETGRSISAEPAAIVGAKPKDAMPFRFGRIRFLSFPFPDANIFCVFKARAWESTLEGFPPSVKSQRPIRQVREVAAPGRTCSTVSRPLNSGIKGGGVILRPTSILVQCPTEGTGILCLRHAFARPEAESPNSFATAAIGAAHTF